MGTASMAVVAVVVLLVTGVLLLVLVRATHELRRTADRIGAARDRLEPVARGVQQDAEAARTRLERLQAPEARRRRG